MLLRPTVTISTFVNKTGTMDKSIGYREGPGVAVIEMRRPGYSPPGMNCLFGCSMKIITINITIIQIIAIIIFSGALLLSGVLFMQVLQSVI